MHSHSAFSIKRYMYFPRLSLFNELMKKPDWINTWPYLVVMYIKGTVGWRDSSADSYISSNGIDLIERLVPQATMVSGRLVNWQCINCPIWSNSLQMYCWFGSLNEMLIWKFITSLEWQIFDSRFTCVRHTKFPSQSAAEKEMKKAHFPHVFKQKFPVSQ